MRLALEIALARAAGRLSRLAGRGGGTTLPGQAAGDDRSRRGRRAGAVACRWERRSSRRRTARRRRPRSSRRSCLRGSGWRTTARARTSSPASPRRCSTRAAPSWACSRSTRARFRTSPGACGRARSASATSSATSSTATASWSRSPSAGARRCASSGRLVLVVNADDPQVGDLATEHAGSVTFGLDDPAQARPSLQHAADSKYCLRCGTPYAYAAAYVGHLGDYRCPRLRPRAAAARGRRACGRARGARRGLVRPRHAGGHTPDPARPSRASTTSTTRWRRPRWRVRSARASTRSRHGLAGRRARVRPVRADRGRRPAACSCS